LGRVYISTKALWAALLIAGALLSAVPPARARQWKATAESLATDYAEILDTNKQGKVVFLMWLVPQMAEDAARTPLKLLSGDAIPPAVAGMVTTVESVMRQTIGAMGKDMVFFVFKGGDVHACQKGELAVPFGGEVYTYKTPIPGCPWKH
jgi:hypothetical protein